jgi:MFS family permease
MNSVYPSRLDAGFSLRLPPLGADEIDLAPDQLALAVIIAQVSRFYDLGVYALAAALVFPRLFFVQYGALGGIALSFAVFSLALVVRPVGAALFASLERRHGRAVKLISAVLLLCILTVALSLLPGSERLGPTAIALLLLIRLGQGLAAAGVGDGSASLRALGGARARRGFPAASPLLAAAIGLALAAGLFAYAAWGASAAEFVAWGWRFPVLVAVAVNLVALFARLRLSASERLGRRWR